MRKRPLLVVALLALGETWFPSSSSLADEHRNRNSKKKSTEPAADSAPAPLPPPELPEALPTYPNDGLPIATALISDDDLGGLEATEILGGFATALATDQRIHYRDIGDLLEPRDEARRQLVEADQSVAEAKTAFDQMDLESARTKAEEAAKTYARHLPQLGAQPGSLARLRDAWIRVAAIRFFDGNNDTARDALRHVFVTDPSMDFSPRVFPPQMKKTVVDGRLMFDALGAGKLNVTSNPPGAAVYLNGAVKGTTPVVIDDAPPGPNSVTVVRRGYQPAVQEVEVSGGGDETAAEVVLATWPDDPFASVRGARAQLGQAAAPEGILRASKRLKADLFVALVGAKTGAAVRLTASLYDARSKQLLKKVTQSGSAEHLAALSQEVANEVFRAVRLDGSFVAPRPATKPLWARMSEFRDSKAFWWVAGGVGAGLVAGGALGLGFGLERHGLSTAEKVILFGAQ